MKKVLVGCGVFVVALVVIAGGALGFSYYTIKGLKDPPPGAFLSHIGQYNLTKMPESPVIGIVPYLRGSGVRYAGAEYTSPEDRRVFYDVTVYGSPEQANKGMLEERDRLLGEEHGSLIPPDPLARDAGIVIETRHDRLIVRHVLWLGGPGSWLCEADSDGQAAQDFEQSFFGGGRNSSSPDSITTAGDASGPTQSSSISAAELYSAYKRDQSAADARYKGMTLSVTGEIYLATEKSITGQPVAAFKVEGKDGVSCSFPEQQKEAVGRLKVGQTATFRCQVKGALIAGSFYGVLLQDCAVESDAAVAANADAGGNGGGDCPTDDQVKQTIQKWLEKGDRQQDRDSKTSVTLDGGVRRGGVTSRNLGGIGNKTVCPAKVDFTVTTDHPARVEVVHWRGGTYEFYRNEFGDWDFELGEQPTHTVDAEKSRFRK